MNRIIMKSRVGTDGVLHVTVPISLADADQEVQVTIEPISQTAMTQEEWRTFVLSTAGTINDPTFIRHEQGHHDPREELP